MDNPYPYLNQQSNANIRNPSAEQSIRTGVAPGYQNSGVPIGTRSGINPYGASWFKYFFIFTIKLS